MKKPLLLAMDIGNSNITIGWFKKNKLLYPWRLPAWPNKNTSYYIRQFIINISKNKIKEEDTEAIIICSVVPNVLKVLKASLKHIFNLKPLVVGEDVFSGVKNCYANPRQVGQDRLVNARAAYEIYKQGCIVVDFGTAITIDVINSKKEYLGGLIAPGLEISLEALARRTALLPELKLSKPGNLVGKNTKESILSGLFYGFSSLCDGAIGKFKAKLKEDLLVIATGGHSRIIASYCKNIDVLRPNLTLEGLRIIYQS